MKTEQEIKEKLVYLKGYRDGGLRYTTLSDDDGFIEGQIKILEWILEVNNGNNK